MAFGLPYATLLTALLLAAGAEDLWRRKVSNGLSVAVLVCGFGVHLVGFDWMGAASGLGACCLMVAVLWLPWRAGGLGGGDLKLAAATAVWFGLGRLPGFFLGVAVAGGVVAALTYALSPAGARKAIKQRVLAAAATKSMPAVGPTHGSDETRRISVPYALAIAAGAVAAMLYYGG